MFYLFNNNYYNSKDKTKYIDFKNFVFFEYKNDEFVSYRPELKRLNESYKKTEIFKGNYFKSPKLCGFTIFDTSGEPKLKVGKGLKFNMKAIPGDIIISGNIKKNDINNLIKSVNYNIDFTPQLKKPELVKYIEMVLRDNNLYIRNDILFFLFSKNN